MAPHAARVARNEAPTAEGAWRALRERANTVLPGLYAWITTLALPCVQRGAPASARVSALLALVALIAAPLFAQDRPLLARVLGIFSFVGLCLLTWALLGAGQIQNPGDPLLSALGAVALTFYALGWGSLRPRDVIPEDNPNVIPGPPLQPRARPHAVVPVAFGIFVVSALVPSLLAFRVSDASRGLFAHAVATLAAVLTITVGSRVALSLGQRRSLPALSERLNAAAVPLALVALLFGLGFLWLVVR